MFLSHRTTIENYLLDPELIHTYWITKYEEKQENPSSKWSHKDSPGIEKIYQWIESAARRLKDYQATRWALAGLVNSNAQNTQLTNTWTGGSGTLPESLTIDDCRRAARSLIIDFRTGLESITESIFDSRLDEYVQRFAKEEFWLQQDYLIWFNGKDIQKQMGKDQNHFISLKEYFKWAVNKLDVNQFPDLIELQKEMRKL